MANYLLKVFLFCFLSVFLEKVSPPPEIPPSKEVTREVESMPYASNSALRKAKYRLKKALEAAGGKGRSLKHFVQGQVENKSQETPRSQKIRKTLERTLSPLKKKRDKESLAKKKLFMELKGETLEKSSTSPYKRKKKHPGTEAAKKFLEEQA